MRSVHCVVCVFGEWCVFGLGVCTVQCVCLCGVWYVCVVYSLECVWSKVCVCVRCMHYGVCVCGK